MIKIFFFLLIFQPNFEEWIKLESNNDNIPIFSISISNFCKRCKIPLNSFLKIQNEYKNNKSIIFSIINCTKYENLCNYLSISSFPSFIISIFNKTQLITSIKDENSIRTIINLILKINLNQKLENINKSKNFYPYFNISYLKNDLNFKKLIYNYYCFYFEDIPLKINFIESNITEIKSILDYDILINFNLNFLNLINLKKFFNNYFYNYFGNWTFESISKISNPFIIFFINSNEELKEYKLISKNYLNNFSFGLSNSLNTNQLKNYFNYSINKKNYLRVFDIF